MTQEMKLKVAFPTWESLSPDLKGLLSVYMEDATFRCVGSYTDDNNWSYISGAIMSTSQISTNTCVLMNTYGDYIAWYYSERQTQSVSKLSIPYTDANSPLFTPQTSGAACSEMGMQYEVPDVCTVLRKASTNLKMYQCSGYTDEDLPVSIGTNATTFNNIPCTITPLINDVENTDSSLIPNDITRQSEDITGCCTYKITQGFDVATIDTDVNDHNFIMQTDPFVINKNASVTSSYDIEDTKTVFYKVGVYCLDTPISYGDNTPDTTFEQAHISSIKDFIISRIMHPDFKFCMYNIDLSCNNIMRTFGFSSVCFNDIDFRVGLIKDILNEVPDISDSAVPVFNTVYSDFDVQNCSVLRNLIAPIGIKYRWTENGTPQENTSVLGFLYMKLYNADGTPVTDPMHNVVGIGGFNSNGYTYDTTSGQVEELKFKFL